MERLEAFLDHFSEIEEKIGYTFTDKSLLTLAFTHRSYVNENRDRVDSHNERLEFLGDAILGMVISEFLYCNYPDMSEGDLSFTRSKLVDAHSCIQYIHEFGVEDYVLLSKGERGNDGRARESIFADLFEALIAAIFLDGGYEAVKKVMLSRFSKMIETVLAHLPRNWKADLQDYAQRLFQSAPTYQVVREFGPDHKKTFEVSVLVDSQQLAIGQGASKKEAQQHAAQCALEKIEGEYGEE